MDVGEKTFLPDTGELLDTGEKISLLLVWLRGENTPLLDEIVSFDTGEFIWLVGEKIPLVTELVPLGETSWLDPQVLLDLVILFASGSTNSDVLV